MPIGVGVHFVKEHGLADATQASQHDPSIGEPVAGAGNERVERLELTNSPNEFGRPAAGPGAVRVESWLHLANSSEVLANDQSLRRFSYLPSRAVAPRHACGAHQRTWTDDLLPSKFRPLDMRCLRFEADPVRVGRGRAWRAMQGE